MFLHIEKMRERKLSRFVNFLIVRNIGRTGDSADRVVPVPVLTVVSVTVLAAVVSVTVLAVVVLVTVLTWW